MQDAANVVKSRSQPIRACLQPPPWLTPLARDEAHHPALLWAGPVVNGCRCRPDQSARSARQICSISRLLGSLARRGAFLPQKALPLTRFADGPLPILFRAMVLTHLPAGAGQACLRVIRLLALDRRISPPANLSVLSRACHEPSPNHFPSRLVALSSRAWSATASIKLIWAYTRSLRPLHFHSLLPILFRHKSFKSSGVRQLTRPVHQLLLLCPFH